MERWDLYERSPEQREGGKPRWYISVHWMGAPVDPDMFADADTKDPATREMVNYLGGLFERYGTQ